jgi:dsDNA-binding SOS-regulon protein
MKFDKMLTNSNNILQNLFDSKDVVKEDKSENSLFVSGNTNRTISKIVLNKDLTSNFISSNQHKTICANAGFRHKPNTALHLRNLSTRVNFRGSNSKELQTLTMTKFPSPVSRPQEKKQKNAQVLTTPLEGVRIPTAFKSFDER